MARWVRLTAPSKSSGEVLVNLDTLSVIETRGDGSRLWVAGSGESFIDVRENPLEVVGTEPIGS
jgi:hypothetical protein